MGSVNSTQPTQLQVAFYRYHGGGPPHRGMKLCETQNYQFYSKETVGEMVESLIASEEQAYNSKISFFLRPGPASSLPLDWDGSGSPVHSGDSRLIAEVMTSTYCVVMLIPMEADSVDDIGVFVAPSDRVVVAKDVTLPSQEVPGAEWLQCPELPAKLDPAQVVAVALAVGGTAALGILPPPTDGRSWVAAEKCDALVAQVDMAWEAAWGHAGLGSQVAAAPVGNSLEQSVHKGSRRDDFKMLLNTAALIAAVGAETYAGIVELLDTLAPGGRGREPDAIAVRRTEASGRWIGFHTDRAAATVQVPLRSDEAGSGGRLVFLGGDGVVAVAPRETGALLGHRGDTVHGVTRLVAGRRYGLFVLRARPGDAGPGDAGPADDPVVGPGVQGALVAA